MLLVTSTPRQPVLSSLYLRYLDDENTAGFVQAVSQRYSVATLERLVVSGSRLTRRAASMALGFLGNYTSTAVLSQALQDQDKGVRLLAEAGVRELWCRDGSDSQRQQLKVVARLNSSEQFADAVDAASELIDAAPAFAEAWNQRAIALFNLQQYDDSIRDCKQALLINPQHFGAAIGLAHCLLEKNDAYGALEVFRQALEIHPDMEGVRAQVSFLEQALEERLED